METDKQIDRQTERNVCVILEDNVVQDDLMNKPDWSNIRLFTCARKLNCFLKLAK